MEIAVLNANGKRLHMRCEMRAATLLKRSGWSPEMFKVGSRVEIEGHPHRTDAHACYIEHMKIGDAPKLNRNDQFETSSKVDTSKRPLKLADGQPNISGDWAVEQLVLTVPPSGGDRRTLPHSRALPAGAGAGAVEPLVLTVPPGGGNGSMIPKSLSSQFAAGKITLEQVQATQPPR